MSVIATAIGVDMVDCARLDRLVQADSTFLALSFTPEELAACRGDSSRLASRWAAKEATMKALGRGIGAVALKDIEVRSDDYGAPTLLLSGAARDRADELGCTQWSVSLSHECGMALAFVVIVREGHDV